MFFECPTGGLLSIAPLLDGRIAAGADADGVVYMISDRENYTVSSIEEAGKILSIQPEENGFLATTDSKGFVCRAVINGKLEGEYISRVVSVTEVEKWGICEIREEKNGSDLITYELRTGKSPNTDDKWSDWIPVKAGELPSLDTGCRYFQLRVLMKDADGGDRPKLQKLELSYLPKNIAPEISLFQDAAALKKKAPAQMPKPGAPKQVGPAPKPPFIMLQWKAMDKNMDKLSYSISYKAEGEDIWMTAEEDLQVVKYNLDTTYIPDGKYRVRLTASDEEVNMPGKGFSVHKELDEPVVIDKTPPIILEVKLTQADNGVGVTCSVSDMLSKITHGFYRINNGDWLPVFPEDQLYDELSETFSFTAVDAAADDVLFLRFIDEGVNSGLYRTVLSK